MSADAAAYDAWARYYDIGEGDRRPHVDFYSSLLRAGDRSVLEIGCGTGVVAAALAECIVAKGGVPRIVGLDVSASMLEVARARYPGYEWLQADMRAPVAGGPFDLLVCCFNTLQFMPTEADLLQAFVAARDCVAADGRFAFDLYQPNLPYLRVARKDSLARRLMHGGRELWIREDARFDEASHLLELDWRLVAANAPGEVLAATHFSLRQFSADEVVAVLGLAGWQVLERFGDLARAPFTPASKKQVLVCGPG